MLSSSKLAASPEPQRTRSATSGFLAMFMSGAAGGHHSP
jgi:hypothetical protein